jgi:predicted enzyme related to lactoylglutathione lyase
MTIFISAILVRSKDPLRLYNFYKTVLGIPLEVEHHGDSEVHYGCEIGDIHFAIHRADEGVGVGATRIAFEIFDMQQFIERVEGLGIKLLYPAKDLGFMLLTAFEDPDGNTVEVTQLSEKWYRHLEKRRSQGHDIVQHWKALKDR